MNHQDHQHQWHVTAEGIVLSSYPKRGDPSRMEYERYDPNRRLELTDLYALDERLERFDTNSTRLAWVIAAVVLTGGIGAVAGVVLLIIGIESVLTVVLLAVSVPVVVAGGLGGLLLVQASMRRRLDKIFHEAGFESVEPKMMLKAPEALALIEAPGTVSGPRRVGG